MPGNIARLPMGAYTARYTDDPYPGSTHHEPVGEHQWVRFVLADGEVDARVTPDGRLDLTTVAGRAMVVYPRVQNSVAIGVES